MPPPLPARALPVLDDSDILEESEVTEEGDELRAVSHTAPPEPPKAPRRGLKVAAVVLSIGALVATSFAVSLTGLTGKSFSSRGDATPAARAPEPAPAQTPPTPTEDASALAKKPTPGHGAKAPKPAPPKKLAKAKATSKPGKHAKPSQNARGKAPNSSTKANKRTAARG